MSEPGTNPTPATPVEPSVTPTPTGTGTPPVNNGGEPETLTLTTKQLAARLDTEVNKALSRTFETLGVKDLNELTAKLTAQKEREDAEKTELQKAQDALKAAQDKAAAAEAKAAETARQALEKERNNAILLALTGKTDKPQKVLTLLINGHAADVDGVMAADGTVDAQKVSALIDKAKKEYPEDFKSGGPGSPSNAGGRTPAPDHKSILDQLPKVRL